MLTHRCEGSLKNNCSIRHNTEGWWLLVQDCDIDYDWIGLRIAAPIRYCPFCGELLEDIQ